VTNLDLISQKTFYNNLTGNYTCDSIIVPIGKKHITLLYLSYNPLFSYYTT